MAKQQVVADETSAAGSKLTGSGADLWNVREHVERPASKIPVVYDVDVAVAGGGISGMLAAIAAGRLGAKTLVVEPFGCLGGNMGPGMFAGGSLHLALQNPEAFKNGLGGLPQEFNERVTDGEKRNVGTNKFRDSKKVPYVATVMLEEAGVEILLSSLVVDVITEGNKVCGIFVENKSGTLAIKSKVVVDCTGTADIADRAGAPVAELAQNPSMGSFFAVDGVDGKKYVEAKEALGELGNDDKLWMAQHGVESPHFMPWAREAWESGEFEISQVVGDFAVLDLSPMPVKVETTVFSCRTRVNGNFHPGDGLALSKIQQRMWPFLYEFVCFLNNRVPGFEDAGLSVVSPYFQARGGKSIDSEYMLTHDDVKKGARFDDLMFTYYDDKIFVEGGCDVPYRMIIPKGVDGLIAAGRSAMKRGPQFRQRYCAQLMGQAAGVAAALSAQHDVAPRDLDTRTLQKALYETGSEMGPESRVRELGLV